MEWVKRNHYMEQVGRFVPRLDETNHPDPLVRRAGIAQSFPSYKVSRCAFDDEYILCLVTQGRGWLVTKGRKIDLTVGDMFCLFPAVAAEYGTDPHHLMHKSWVGFTGTQIPGLISELGLQPVQPMLSLGSTVQTILPLVNEIRHELLAGKPGFTWRATGFLWQVLGSLHTLIQRPAENTPPSVELIRQAARYIDAHFADISRVSDIAKYTKLSRSHFSTLFKQEMGISPLDYLNDVRLVQAERLLSQTSHPIKSIAMSVGIQDRAYFSRLFTLKRGISPQQYRYTQQSPDRSS